MTDDFDNSPDSDEILESENTLQQAAVFFEEYRDCFGDPHEVMRKHLLCTMCGGHLHFNHLTDFPHGLIRRNSEMPRLRRAY